MRAGRTLLLGLLTYGCGLTTSDPNTPEDGPLGGNASDGGQGTGGRSAGGQGGYGSSSGPAGGSTASGGATVGGGPIGATGGASTGAGGSGDPEACTGTRAVAQALYLRNQRDVETFGKVRRFEGSLYITGDVLDLSPLACLTEITGELGVFETTKLRSLTGLEALRSVGGLVAIGHYCTTKQSECVGNPLLEDVNALHGLESASKILIRPKCAEDEGGPYDCAFNAALQTVSFDNLREASALELERNPLLEEALFDGLESATSVHVTSNERLKALSFASLTTLKELRIADAPELEELRTSELVHGDVIDMLFVALQDLRGLGKLESVGVLDLSHNALTTLTGLEKLSAARSIGIKNHAQLLSIEALGALKNVSEDLYLFSNPRLRSLSGLESLQHARGMTVAYNDALEDLAPLTSLETAPGWLGIRGNKGLLSLHGLEKLETTKSLSIESNPLLPSLEGLDGFQSVDFLSISGNVVLPTCEAERFAARLMINESPSIAYNDDLGICAP